MSASVLLVSTATQWFATARIPRALARAGFDVSLLTPKGSLAEQSRYIRRIGHLPDNATPLQWVHAFAATVKATTPRIVIPCDDMSFQLLQTLARTPPENMQPTLRVELAALIRGSLGDPDAHRALSQPAPPDLAPAEDMQTLVQAHVPGRRMCYQIAAWEGRLLAGLAAETVVADPEPTGPATVVRYHRNDEVREFARLLVEGLGISGLLALELTVDERTRVPCLLEINRRITPEMHRGASIGVDLCAALFAALHGTASTSRADLDVGEERTVCHFPQEWLRDPRSTWLRRFPVDIPWDEPELIEAMLQLRRER